MNNKSFSFNRFFLKLCFPFIAVLIVVAKLSPDETSISSRTLGGGQETVTTRTLDPRVFPTTTIKAFPTTIPTITVRGVPTTTVRVGSSTTTSNVASNVTTTTVKQSSNQDDLMIIDGNRVYRVPHSQQNLLYMYLATIGVER